MREFTFEGDWTVPGSPAAVRDVVVDLEYYPSWWREIRAVARLGDDEALVVCRSWLPYSLDLHLTAVRRELPVLEVALDGDLEGMARWSLSPAPNGTRMHFEQRVRVARRPLAVAAFLARPVLVWNHDRMMRSGVLGLSRRVAARGERSDPGNDLPEE